MTGITPGSAEAAAPLPRVRVYNYDDGMRPAELRVEPADLAVTVRAVVDARLREWSARLWSRGKIDTDTLNLLNGYETDGTPARQDAQAPTPTGIYIAELERRTGAAEQECDDLRRMLMDWGQLAKGLNFTKFNGEVSDYDDELASLLVRVATETLAWRDDPNRDRGSMPARNGEKTPEAQARDAAEPATPPASPAAPAGEAHFRAVPDGPPCPTCGFRIRKVERPPFVLDDGEPAAPAPRYVTKAEAAILHDALKASTKEIHPGEPAPAPSGVAGDVLGQSDTDMAAMQAEINIWLTSAPADLLAIRIAGGLQRAGYGRLYPLSAVLTEARAANDATLLQLAEALAARDAATDALRRMREPVRNTLGGIMTHEDAEGALGAAISCEKDLPFRALLERVRTFVMQQNSALNAARAEVARLRAEGAALLGEWGFTTDSTPPAPAAAREADLLPGLRHVKTMIVPQMKWFHEMIDAEIARLSGSRAEGQS